jgi:hypothetical protein
MTLSKNFIRALLLVIFIILLAAGVCNAASYVFLAPPGMSTFIDKNGTSWTPDANGMVTVTDPSVISCLLNAGFVLLPQPGAAATHNYGGASSGAGLTWTLAPGESAADFLVATNAGAAVTAIASPSLGNLYLVYNNTGYALTFMAASQTGVVIPNGRTAHVRGNGTDFQYATDDAVVPNASIWNATVPVVLKKDIATSYAATNTTTNGTSYTVPANLFVAGKAMRVTVSGTSAGANAAKSVKLSVGGTVLGTAGFLSTMVGNWTVTFIMTEYTGLANQMVDTFGVAGTNAGATTSFAADHETGTINFAGAITVLTQVTSASASDTVTQTNCVIELLP